MDIRHIIQCLPPKQIKIKTMVPSEGPRFVPFVPRQAARAQQMSPPSSKFFVAVVAGRGAKGADEGDMFRPLNFGGIHG